ASYFSRKPTPAEYSLRQLSCLLAKKFSSLVTLVFKSGRIDTTPSPFIYPSRSFCTRQDNWAVVQALQRSAATRVCRETGKPPHLERCIHVSRQFFPSLYLSAPVGDGSL